MPGICGFYNVSSDPRASRLLEHMVDRLGLQFCRPSNQLVDRSGHFGLAQASLGISPTAPQPARLPDDVRVAVFDGEIFDSGALCATLRSQGIAVRADDSATLLLRLVAQRGAEAVASLDGLFAAAIVDPSEQTLTLISDRFGTRPIYYVHTSGRFIFASNIWSLLADADVSRAPNWEGVAQFFSFGHYFHDDTSLEAVKILPAAAVLVFDAPRNSFEIRRYWHGAQRVGSVPSDRHAAFEAIDDAFVQSVKKCTSSPDANLGMSLSGGLDARTILGVLERPSDRLTTVCSGMASNRDHRSAAKLARIVGCEHHNHTLDADFLANYGRHLDEMVRLTDGQYLSQSIVMPTLPLYQQLGIGILLRGHAGELMHMTKAYNYSLDVEGLALRDKTGLEAWLWSRLQAHLQKGVDEPLFARRELQVSQLARESLRAALAETEAIDRPVERIAHVFLDQRVRRETMLSMVKFRSVVEPRLPYLDRQLVERLLALPVEWRLDDELQTHILRKRKPEFCDVENTNTGTVLGASSLRRAYAGFKMKVFSKLGVPGYHPYERLGLWLRRELAPLVRRILLSEQCLDRGVFAPDTVRRVVERHLNGRRNHTYLILAMMIFELGQRRLVDEELCCDGLPPQPVASTA
ncbi:MAG: asparagine synthase-related protein [Pirellulales bacterium]